MNFLRNTAFTNCLNKAYISSFEECTNKIFGKTHSMFVQQGCRHLHLAIKRETLYNNHLDHIFSLTFSYLVCFCSLFLPTPALHKVYLFFVHFLYFCCPLVCLSFSPVRHPSPSSAFSKFA